MAALGNQFVRPGHLVALDAGGILKFQYNPEEVTERNSATWANISIHGMTNPRLQYTSGSGRTISFTLKMYHDDDYGWSPGRRIRWLNSLTYPDTGGGMPSRPPSRVSFTLGQDYRGVTCVMLDVEAVSTKFDRENFISYAEVSLSLLEIQPKAIDFNKVRNG